MTKTTQSWKFEGVIVDKRQKNEEFVTAADIHETIEDVDLGAGLTMKSLKVSPILDEND